MKTKNRLVNVSANRIKNYAHCMHVFPLLSAVLIFCSTYIHYVQKILNGKEIKIMIRTATTSAKFCSRLGNFESKCFCTGKNEPRDYDFLFLLNEKKVLRQTKDEKEKEDVALYKS